MFWGPRKATHLCPKKRPQKPGMLSFSTKKGFQKSDPAFLPILALSRKMLGSIVSADRRHALRTPHRARQRAAHLFHKVPPEAPCSHSNETHLPLMVPRLEKGFDASPNTKHRVPGGTAVQTFGQVPKVLSLHHVTSKSPPNCGYEREPWQNLMLEMLQNIGAIGTAAVPLAGPNSNPSLTKHRRPKLFAQSGKKGRLWAARQLLCKIAAGNFVCAFGSAEGLLGVL